MQEDPHPLRPVSVFLPDWSARRIADNARACPIPGAVKVGGMWMLRPSLLAMGCWATGRGDGGACVVTFEKKKATLRRLVRRINERFPAGRFLVPKYRGGALLYYCFACGSPTTARYEVKDEPVDLVDLAGREGVRLTAHELAAIGGGLAA